MKQGTKTIFLVFLNLYGMLCPSYGQGRYISRWYASPYFYRLNTDDGLSNRQVNDIRQDYLGFMWFGTANGLDRYDGHEIKSYYFSIEDTTSITNNNISKVFEDSDQRLWVGTTNGLNLYNREKNNFVQFLNDSTDEKSLGDNQIEDIIEDSEGNIWIATYNGLNRWNEQDSTFTKYLTTTEKKNSYSQIFTILEDRYNNLWLGTQYGGLCKFNRQTGECDKVFIADVNDQYSIPSNFVWDLFEDSEGNFFVSTFNQDLSLFDQNTEKFVNLRSLPTTDSSMAKSHVWSMGEGVDGKPWFGMDKHIMIWDGDIDNPNKFIHIENNRNNPDHSISSSNMLSIYQSDDGIVWIGSRTGGVNYISRESIRFFHYSKNRYDLSSDNVTCFAECSEGNIWVGIDGGGVCILDPVKSTVQQLKSNGKDFSSKNVLALTPDEGGMWLGMWAGGVDFYDYKKQEVTVSLSDLCGVEIDNAFSVKKDSKGTIWVGTWSDGLISYDPSSGKCTTFSSNLEDNEYNISGDDIIAVYVDRKDRVWFSVYGRGFDIYDQSTDTFQNFQPLPSANGLANENIITFFFEDSNGQMWIGSKGAGLLRFDLQMQKFESFKNKNGLPNNEVNSILEGANGDLWIGTNSGLHQFNPNTLEARHYDKTVGLDKSNFRMNSAYRTEEGGMYFGGFHGFNYFHPDSLFTNANSTNLRFTDFKVFNQSVDLSDGVLGSQDITINDKIDLSYEHSVFSIQFAALNYLQPTNTRYKYRLVDFDKDWSYADFQNSSVTYTNLDPGEYDFQVMSTNNDGKWNSEIVSMKINVEPPFWETNWFRFLLISLIAGVALLIHNIRLRYLNRQNLLLEREIKERTKEIEVKNEELTETVEELKSTQEQLVISEKMAALGQLTASVAHEVNTPLGAINSAVDSIQVDLPEVIQEFPLLARVFTESEFNAFSDILENSDEVPFLSTKETRKRRKEIESELDKKGINNGHILASYLVGLNVDIKSNAFNTLVRHKYAPVIFQTASKIINVKNLAGNIGISVQQASKVAFALKRYTHNSHNASKEQFDLRENVLGVLSIFKSQLHNIELNLELGEKIIINGHPSELSQVWLNLIQNAIHAINGKGRIEIEAIPNGRNVNMRISDNGIGIPDEIKDKIFDPFFTTKPYGQGSGLGLDIVNKIIKRHQGSISFDSDKSGTVFKLVLPYDNDTKE